MPRREARSVTGRETVGPYTLLRVAEGGLDPGEPGQFFMLSPPGRLLPRPMSLCLHAAGELGFLIDVVGPGTRALAALEPGAELTVFGPLGTGFRLDVRARCSSAAVSASRPSRTPRRAWAARRRCSVPLGAPRRGGRARPRCRGGAGADLRDRGDLPGP